MSTVHLSLAVVFALSIAGIHTPAHAQSRSLKPFKDDLFSGFQVLESADGGDFEVIDYQEMRDINGRDQVPERRVKSNYVSTGVKKHQANQTLRIDDRRIDVTRIGPERGAAFTVIFIHGRGGDRRLGANDYSFGGNFNRLKNIAVSNGGTYYVPSVTAFDGKGTADIAALIRHASEQSGGKPVMLACASMGGMICSGISRDDEAVRHLGGMALLGGPPDSAFAETAAARRKLPLYLSHGSADSVYAVDAQVAVYKALQAKGYPVRMTVFNTGGHGTPIRMTDWRKVLNFLLSAN